MIEQQQINSNNSQNQNNMSANNNYSRVKIQGSNNTNVSAINRLKEKTSKLVQITYNDNTKNTNVVQINNYMEKKKAELKQNAELGNFYYVTFRYQSKPK